MMEQEVVRRRAWLTREEFLDLLGAVNLIPGPSSTELAIFIGYRRAGWVGLLLGGACFILPSALIVGGCAWAYVRFGALPQVASLLYGVKPVVIAIVLQALLGLGRSAIKSWGLGAIGFGATVASFVGVDALVVLTAGGALCGLATRPSATPRRPSSVHGSIGRTWCLLATPTATDGIHEFCAIAFLAARLHIYLQPPLFQFVEQSLGFGQVEIFLQRPAWPTPLAFALRRRHQHRGTVARTPRRPARTRSTSQFVYADA